VEEGGGGGEIGLPGTKVRLRKEVPVGWKKGGRGGRKIIFERKKARVEIKTLT